MACVRTEEVSADTGLRRTVRTHHDEVGLDRLRLIEDFLVDAALAHRARNARDSKPLSLQMMASASSADLRCCASKSGGTYSASITGVSGNTLTSRIELPTESCQQLGGRDRGFRELGVAKVDRNQNALVHGAVLSQSGLQPHTPFCHAPASGVRQFCHAGGGRFSRSRPSEIAGSRTGRAGRCGGAVFPNRRPGNRSPPVPRLAIPR